MTEVVAQPGNEQITPGVVVETPQTPAATPATPAAPSTPPPAATQTIGDPPATPATETAPAGEAFVYQDTGDAGLDVALNFIGSLGLGPDHAAVKAAMDGKFELLEATLEAMGDKAKGYNRFVALAKDAYSKTAAKAQETNQQITAAVHEVAGNEQTWNAIKDWAGKNADPDEKQAINSMLSAGPIQARAAAMLLGQLYRGAAGTTVTPAQVANPNAGATTTGNGALSPAEYAKAARELRGAMGSRMEGSPEYAALQARRSAWRG